MRSMRLRHTLRTLPALVAGVMACGGDPGPAQPAVPTKLVFMMQPTNATAGVAIASAVQVAIQDASGNTMTSATATVTALSTGPCPRNSPRYKSRTVTVGSPPPFP